MLDLRATTRVAPLGKDGPALLDGLEDDEGEMVSRFAMRSGVMAFEFVLLVPQPADDSLRMLSFILSDRCLDGVDVGGMAA